MMQKLYHIDIGSLFTFMLQAIVAFTEANLLHVLIMSDEVHFQLSENMNKQNFLYWSPENLNMFKSDHLDQKSDCLGFKWHGLGLFDYTTCTKNLFLTIE